MRLGMMVNWKSRDCWLLPLFVLLALTLLPVCSLGAEVARDNFPLPLDSYPDKAGGSFWGVLRERAALEPFNLLATVLFFFAIVHTFLAPMFSRLSHRL